METVVKSLSIADGKIVDTSVSAEISEGIGIHLIGLNDMYVKETLLRVITAIQQSGFNVPGKKIVITVENATKIYRPYLDLPIAVCILKASGQIIGGTDRFRFFGNLDFDGTLLYHSTPIEKNEYVMPEFLICPRIFASAMGRCDRLSSVNTLKGTVNLINI